MSGPPIQVVRKVRGLIVAGAAFITSMTFNHAARIQTNFGDRVRQLRKRKGISQEALGFACGLDRSYIGGVERGERNISLINIYKIAKALGVKAGELFNA